MHRPVYVVLYVILIVFQLSSEGYLYDSYLAFKLLLLSHLSDLIYSLFSKALEDYHLLALLVVVQRRALSYGALRSPLNDH